MAQNKEFTNSQLLGYIQHVESLVNKKIDSLHKSVDEIHGRIDEIEARLDPTPSDVSAVASQSGLQSSVGAVASQSGDMSLTVDIRQLENIRLQVKPSDTISEVKDQIEQKFNISKAKQGFLIHENRQLLEGGKTLSEFDIKSGDKLVLPQSLSVREQAKRMKIGMKVKPGRDWLGSNRQGDVATVTEELYQARDGGEYVRVCWNSDDMTSIESMGKPHGKYMLQLA